jgi:hypothetical protein
MFLVRGTQKQRRRVDRPAGSHYDVRRVFFHAALARDDDFGHLTSGWVRFEAIDIGARQEFDVGVLQGGIHADHLSVGFAVYQAWKSVKRGTSHTGTVVQGLSMSVAAKKGTSLAVETEPGVGLRSGLGWAQE